MSNDFCMLLPIHLVNFSQNINDFRRFPHLIWKIVTLDWEKTILYANGNGTLSQYHSYRVKKDFYTINFNHYLI